MPAARAARHMSCTRSTDATPCSQSMNTPSNSRSPRNSVSDGLAWSGLTTTTTSPRLSLSLKRLAITLHPKDDQPILRQRRRRAADGVRIEIVGARRLGGRRRDSGVEISVAANGLPALYSDE